MPYIGHIGPRCGSRPDKQLWYFDVYGVSVLDDSFLFVYFRNPRASGSRNTNQNRPLVVSGSSSRSLNLGSRFMEKYNIQISK